MSETPRLGDSLRLYRRLLRYAQPYKWMFALAIVALMVLSSTDGAFVALMKPMLDRGFVAKDPGVIRWLPLALVALAVARGVSNFVAEYAMAWVGRRVVFDLRNAMFAHLVHLPASFYDANSSGVLISKVIYDVDQVATAATRALTTLVKDNLVVLFMLVWMTYLNWRLTLLFVVIGPLVGWIMRRMSQRFRAIARALQRSMGGISHVVQEAIDGHRVVKTFCAQDAEIALFKDANNKNRQQAMKKVATSAAGVSLIHFLAVLALAWVVYLALAQSAAGHTTVGDFGSYIAAVMMLTAPVRRLAQVNEIFQTGLAASQSVFALLDEVREPDRGTRALPSVRGRVEYRDVTFRYPTGHANALHDVSFVIEPGETVALVGPSGSGKTTIAGLLPRFYSPSAGRILLDGVPIEELALNDLRGHIALVSQETVLFDDSVRNNIAYGLPNATDARIREAARAAHVLEFARDMPQGLDALIGEKGVRLSGGQRQRIAIARALLKDAPVLILDEATSSLDTESERLVQDGIQHLIRNRTTLVIAHRLSTIEKADRILVIQNGRIVESGTHRELVVLDRLYARLHRLQFSEA